MNKIHPRIIRNPHGMWAIHLTKKELLQLKDYTKLTNTEIAWYSAMEQIRDKGELDTILFWVAAGGEIIISEFLYLLEEEKC